MTGTRDERFAPSLVARYLMGSALWAVVLSIYLLLDSAALLLVTLVAPVDLGGSWPLVIHVLLYVVIGLPAGWVGEAASARFRLNYPTWWAPSLTAAVILMAATSIAARAYPWSLVTMMLYAAALGPVFVGQATCARATSAKASD